MKSDNPNPYADIIDLPHHVSKRHPQMPMEKRTAPSHSVRMACNRSGKEGCDVPKLNLECISFLCNRSFLIDRQSILSNITPQKPHSDPSLNCLLPSLSKSSVRLHIGTHLFYFGHLDNKRHAAPVSLLPCDIVTNLDSVLEEFDRVIGIDRLKAIHINDSLNPLGSHKDRHARIGEGCIGLAALAAVTKHPKLRELPFILETPNDNEGYAEEIALLRNRFRE